MDTVRDAVASDAARIGEIYNQAVVNTTATFDVEPKSPEDRAEWLANEHGPKHPVLVAERNGDVVAWGSLSSVSDRCAWDGTVEISTYVDDAHTRTGLGLLLGEALLARARALDYHVMISRVSAENVASIRLTERLGFARAGELHEVGRKFGRWLDVVYLEKLL